MELKHTPPPWKAMIDGPQQSGGDWGAVEAITEDGKYVRREICHFLLDTGGDDDEDRELEEDLANARLIAAAPDGLAFALMFVAWDDDRHAIEVRSSALREAADAYIAKATAAD